MRILIINPPADYTCIEAPDENGKDFIESSDYGDFPPLGALYVLSMAEKELPHHEYFFKDCVGENTSLKELTSYLDDIKPDLVGITSFTISLVDVCMVADLVKELHPDCHLVLGGHHPTAFPYESTELKQFDSVVIGEGEYAFVGLVKALEAGTSVTEVHGVYDNEKIKLLKGKTKPDRRFLNHVIVPPGYVEDINKIPIPNRKYISHIKYRSTVGLTGNLATIISSRGCPYLCTFCEVPYKQYRERDPKLLCDEIEQCLELGYEEFHFYDDLFNISVKKINAFCDELEKRKLKIRWDFRGRVNAVTKETLARCVENGLRMISFGVETGSNEGLLRLKKGTTVKQVQNSFKWCRELGIKTVANFMIGLPHEKNAADVMSNIDMLIDLDPDYLKLAILSLYPRTSDFELAIKMGLIENGRFEKWVINPTPGFHIDHWEEFLSLQELVNLKKSAYKNFYFRPKHLLRNIMQTSSIYEFGAKARGATKILLARNVS